MNLSREFPSMRRLRTRRRHTLKELEKLEEMGLRFRGDAFRGTRTYAEIQEEKLRLRVKEVWGNA